ncbi:MAG: hypothetical protein ACRC33_16540, partial [Gemmataceae bacterium]
EVDAFAGEVTRLTLVRSPTPTGLAVRFQHSGIGSPQPGPDVPVDSFGDVVNAIRQLLGD